MTYSRRKRQREQDGKTPLFRNGVFGTKLLNQIYQIISEMDLAFGYEKRVTGALVDYLRKEMGLIRLNKGQDSPKELYAFFVAEQESSDERSFDLRLDTVELACVYAEKIAHEIDYKNITSYRPRISPEIARLIEVMNARMLEDGFGFQYDNGQIIEITSQFAYKNVIEPALGLISDLRYETVNLEFRDALEEFKQGNFDDCIADCGNAFESTLKIIASIKNWNGISDNDTSHKLLDAAFREGLVPPYMQAQFNGLRSTLMGVSTVRNREGGHGAGASPRIVDKHLAAYQLQQTAGVIVFLIACAK